MAVSKRLRYEVFRRDNHACRYCGARAPEVTLTIDHVVPGALGGDDEPANLVTACKDCNSGKSSSSPDAPIVADVSADALRWAQAMREAAEMMLRQHDEQSELLDRFTAAWEDWHFGSKYHPRTVPLPADWESSVKAFLVAGLPMDVLLECVNIAMRKQHVSPDQTWRYMCGIAWRKVGELREIAASIAETPGPEAKPWCGKCHKETRLLGYGRDDSGPVRRCPDCHYYSAT